MMYYKMIGDRQVFSDCHTIQTDEGVFISNPSQQQIFDAGWQIYEPPVVPPTPQTEPDMYDVMEAVKKMLATSTVELSDEDALSVAALYPTWASKVGQSVNVGERYWYDGKLWKVVQAHTVQEDWTPDVSASLFTEVSIEEWPDLVVPIPSTNPYMKGDKVTYNGNHYICLMDNCVWTPSELISAWQLVES